MRALVGLVLTQPEEIRDHRGRHDRLGRRGCHSIRQGQTGGMAALPRSTGFGVLFDAQTDQPIERDRARSGLDLQGRREQPAPLQPDRRRRCHVRVGKGSRDRGARRGHGKAALGVRPRSAVPARHHRPGHQLLGEQGSIAAPAALRRRRVPAGGRRADRQADSVLRQRRQSRSPRRSRPRSEVDYRVRIRLARLELPRPRVRESPHRRISNGRGLWLAAR